MMERIEGTDHWESCPKCKGDMIEGGNIEIEGLDAWQQVVCLECETDWVEVYHASHRERERPTVERSRRVGTDRV